MERHATVVKMIMEQPWGGGGRWEHCSRPALACLRYLTIDSSVSSSLSLTAQARKNHVNDVQRPRPETTGPRQVFIVHPSVPTTPPSPHSPIASLTNSSNLLQPGCVEVVGPESAI